MDISIPKNPVTLPSELSPLTSRREPGGLSHLWRRNVASQMHGNDMGNATRQLQVGLNRLYAPPYMVASGAHPFQIYQVPPQYQDVNDPDAWLKFRVRNANVTYRPLKIKDGAGTVKDDWSMYNGDCFYSTDDDDFALGMPSTISAFYSPPFTDNDELYSVNSFEFNDDDALVSIELKDPDFLFDIPRDLNMSDAIALFWISIDFDDEFSPLPVIHFGGNWFPVGGGGGTAFGDTIPDELKAGSGSVLGPNGLQPTANILTSVRLIGAIQMVSSTGNSSLTQTNGIPIITQVLRGHVVDIPVFPMNFAGSYQDDSIYWPGDTLWWNTDSGNAYFILDPSGDIVPSSGDIRTKIPRGVSGYPPEDDLSNNNYWKKITVTT